MSFALCVKTDAMNVERLLFGYSSVPTRNLLLLWRDRNDPCRFVYGSGCWLARKGANSDRQRERDAGTYIIFKYKMRTVLRGQDVRAI